MYDNFADWDGKTPFETKPLFYQRLSDELPGGGFIPDFDARYPTVDLLLTWCQKAMGKQYLVDGALNGPDLAETFAPQRYGFRSLDDLPEVRDAK